MKSSGEIMKDVDDIKRKKREEIMNDLKGNSTSKNSKVKIEVITSPGCPHCPKAVKMAEELSNSYEKVESQEVSITTKKGKEKAKKHRIMGTPTVLANDEVVSVGVPDPKTFENKIESMI